MKILMLSPDQSSRWNPGHQQFRDEVGRQHEVRFYGPGYSAHKLLGKCNDVPTILQYFFSLDQWQPDAIMTYGLRCSLPFTGLSNIAIPKINIICDFTPAKNGWQGTIGGYYAWILHNRMDILFVMSYQALEWFEKNDPNRKVFYLPFGVDEKIYKPRMFEPHEKRYKAYVGWSHHDAVYPMRRPVEKALRERFTPGEVLIKRSFGAAFIENMNRAYVNPNCANLFNTMNMKTFEVMACASLLMTEKTRELEDLGYKDLDHYVAYSSPEDLVDKVEYFSTHPNIRKEIADRGYYLTIKHNTNKHRVEEMTRRLHETI